MIVKEFRIPLPLTLEEYRIGQLYSVGEASKYETGGGEGVEIVINEPRIDGLYAPCQKTCKIIHMNSKVPAFIRALAPSGSLGIQEESWNAYPFCITKYGSPYMKDSFELEVKTLHKPGIGDIHNVHGLSEEEYSKVTVDEINIWDAPHPADYNPAWDPRLVRSEKADRGPLKDANWKETTDPVMCVYKQVSVNFQWYNLQETAEKKIMKALRRLFFNFHRQVVCWQDDYHGMTIEDIRVFEVKTKEDLDRQFHSGVAKGMRVK